MSFLLGLRRWLGRWIRRWLVGCLAAVAGLACSQPASAETPTRAVDDFACFDQSGKFQRLSRQSDARFVVLYVFMDDCPIVRQNASELVKLAAEFEPRGVRFLGLDPAPQDSRARVQEECANLGIDLPILLDERQCASEMLGVTRSGEALVIATKDRQLLWRGPLDDRLEYGAQRAAASRGFLREALEALLGERTPPADVPLAKGCAITYLQPREKHAVEYVKDVAPILARRCTACHEEGGIGPWKMDAFETVRGFGAMMRQELLAERMPPWHADPNFGEFEEDIGLDPEEARTIVHWVERGFPRGTGEDPLATKPVALPEWPLGPPDLVVTLPVQHIPATGRIPNVDLEIELTDLVEDRWVRAVDLRPSNYEVLHHAFAFVPGLQERDTLEDQLHTFAPAIREQAQRWLADNQGTTAELPREVMEFLHRKAFQGRTYFAKYFPGQLVEQFPAGTGKLLPAKTKLQVELHYTTNGAETIDRPRLGLYFHDKAPSRELKVASAWTRDVGLEPHQRRPDVSAERQFDEAFTLYSMSPHMHYRGRSMRYTALLPDGTSECLLYVADYVFDWQANYTLVTPRHFPAGTRILCESVYDNTAQNEYNPDPNLRVRFGPRTEDEMFVGYIVYAKE